MSGRLSRRNRIFLIIVVILILLMVMLTFFASDILDRKKLYPILTLDEDWQVTRNGTTLQTLPLSRNHLEAVHNGDVFVMETTLPEEEILSAAIRLTIKQAQTTVFLNDVQFYEYGEALHAQGRMLKRGALTIPLPAGWQGGTLKIRLKATEAQAFSILGPVILGNEQELYFDFLEERRLPMLLGVFLIVYSIFQLLWLPYLFFRGGGAISNPLYSALITMVLGVYLLGNYDLFDVLSPIGTASTIAEYAALYLIPGLFSAYLGVLQTGRVKQVCNLCAIVDLAMVGAVFFLHGIGAVHLTLFISVFYIVSLIESILFFIGMRQALPQFSQGRTQDLETWTDYAIFLGFFVFVVCAFIDIFLYLFTRFFAAGATSDGAPFMMFGSMIFTITLTAQFFLHGVSHLRADVTRGRLEERAYQDPLTGLANRIRCEQRMNELSLEEPFVIISLDLDGLKSVNDNIGHAEGDRMLKGFALALQQCFEGMTLTGRMGGDEFLVILTGTECAVTDAKLRELERALFNLNLEEPYFHYSVSYGYASNTETHFGKHVRDIYMLADRRMYDMKRKKKQEKEASHG